ncbi:MAG TPA: phosphoribosylamine--glycine ligase [Myxococcales bacterium]
MKVAVLGSGGREHALCWALARHGHQAVALPGNGGTPLTAPIAADDLEGVARYCRDEGVGLVIVGPEAPLVKGMVDFLRSQGVAALGPTREAARLEGSKLFSKKFMLAHGIPTAKAWVFEEGGDPVEAFSALDGQLVLKFDGLAAGKGVWVCDGLDEAFAALSELRSRHGPKAGFLVEEKLSGNELSVIALADGEHIFSLPASQDHKALMDGDLGPNTGGMGAFCPVPQVDEPTKRRIDAEIVRPTLAGLKAEKFDYRGFLYFGLMLTEEGPKLLEYNVRLGDPEAEAMLPMVDTDLAVLAQACLQGKLDEVKLEVARGAAACVVLAARGYPGDPEFGREISGLDLLDPQTLVFHAGTRRVGDRWVTHGGRVLDVVARGETLSAAVDRAYQEVAKIRFDGMQVRKDIGRRPWKRDGSA